jgi:hypothetical protein
VRRFRLHCVWLIHGQHFIPCIRGTAKYNMKVIGRKST